LAQDFLQFAPHSAQGFSRPRSGAMADSYGMLGSEEPSQAEEALAVDAPAAEATAAAPAAESPATETAVAEAPVAEATVAESPAAEAPVAESQATEALSVEATAASAASADGLVADAPLAEAPSPDAPPAESPPAEAPAAVATPADASSAEAPPVEAPQAEASSAEAPLAEAPPAEASAEAPPAEASAEAPPAEVPPAESSSAEAPAAEASPAEAPLAEAPAAEASSAEAPLAEAPPAEASPAEAPSAEVPLPKVAAQEAPPELVADQPKEEEDEEEKFAKEEAAAALRIQSLQRGKAARRELSQLKEEAAAMEESAAANETPPTVVVEEAASSPAAAPSPVVVEEVASLPAAAPSPKVPKSSPKTRKKSPPKESASAQLSPKAASGDGGMSIGAIIAYLSKCTATALGHRQKDLMPRAIRHMEKALLVCEGREGEHPALAVEAARARVNLGAMLSQEGRHVEALVAIKEAQRGVASVLKWASDCGDGDPGVVAITEEARALQCAAVVAEAIELEPASVPAAAPQQDNVGLSRKLYSEARALARDQSLHNHPIASLAQRLGNEFVAPSPEPSRGVVLPQLRKANGATQAASSGQVRSVRASPSAPTLTQTPAAANQSAVWGGAAAELIFATPAGEVPQKLSPTSAAGEGASLLDSSTGSNRKANLDARNSSKTSTVSRLDKQSAGGRSQRRGSSMPAEKSAKPNVFTDFLQSAKADQELRRGAMQDSFQDDIKKHLHQVHRTTKLLLEQSTDEDLLNKRYTATGHSVYMKSMLKENASRSDSTLAYEARKAGDAPETHQVRKLFRMLYVKPPTPEPVVVEPKKPQVSADLALGLRPSVAQPQ